jgi:hypothetical protein
MNPGVCKKDGGDSNKVKVKVEVQHSTTGARLGRADR